MVSAPPTIDSPRPDFPFCISMTVSFPAVMVAVAGSSTGSGLAGGVAGAAGGVALTSLGSENSTTVSLVAAVVVSSG